MKTKFRQTLLLFLLLNTFSFNGCWVAAKVDVKAPTIAFPVSYSDTFYSQKDSLITADKYQIKESFKLSFSKWAVGFPLNLGREADISNTLNTLIDKNEADAIVNLTIAVSNPEANVFFLFTKILSFFSSMVFIPITIADPSIENGLIAATSLAIYLFSPARADIEIQGQVVKLNK